MSFLERPDAPPARVVEVRESAVGLDAVVVIDHELFPKAAGGTRMVPDVTVDEVARLARAMTWKFAVCGVPYAGAKAGIRFTGGDRDEILTAFLDRIAAWSDYFLTGPDMGTNPEDFLRFAPDGEKPPMWARRFEGTSMDDLSVGHGIKGAAEVALARLGRPLADASVAIEGFGKAGAGTARAFARAGARVVGISTVAGCVADPGGLDVEELLRLRTAYGDEVVRHADADARPREELFTLECDVLVPGARPDSIPKESVDALRCAVVVPAANIPYGPGAVEALGARGIVALPDFITNAGGIHLYEAPECRDDPATCLAAIERLIGETTGRVLDAAEADAVTPTDAALEIARDFLRAATE
ncbi:MAG: Glu/Leu/Phe/Val dehydrogenase [Actinomycetota bacterium]|nr:Glu/Leu/Phe/Val dehydrogenase [Actinomycetota bacterium]